MADDISISAVLRGCLKKLGKAEHLHSHIEYLSEEWYMTVADLRLAIDDGRAWSDLKLPGRLKLELKTEILKITSDEKELKIWIKCFSADHSCFYYYNPETYDAVWEEPSGRIYTPDEWATTNGVVDSTQAHNEEEAILEGLLDSLTTDPMKSVPAIPSCPPAYVYNDSGLPLRPYPNAPDLQFSTGTNFGNPEDSSMFQKLKFTAPLKVDAPLRKEPMRILSNRSDDEDDSLSDGAETKDPDFESIVRLVEMGFAERDAISALEKSNNDLPAAAALLVRLLPRKPTQTSPERIGIDVDHRDNVPVAMASPVTVPVIESTPASPMRERGSLINIFGERQSSRSSTASSLVRRLGMGRSTTQVTQDMDI